MENKTMMTDFYELTMAQSYFDQGKKDEIAYFDVFFRTNPFNGGYTISGGLDRTIEYLQKLKFDDSDIEYLRSTNCFSEEFLKYLKGFGFTGDVYSVPDGTVVFPNEPIITIRSNIIECQIIETMLLMYFNSASLIMTKSMRITNAAEERPVMEFGARRARGDDCAVEASKYSYIGGCSGTSNVYAGMKYGLPLMGTMAHSFIQESDCEYDAFLAYAKSHPNNCVFLVDTYDVLKSGIPNAIRVSREYLEPNGYRMKGIRIDSGDLINLSKMARELLDSFGYNDVNICLSNGLDEYSISHLISKGAMVNSFGIGDNITASKERIGGVYKLVAIEKNNEIVPKIKVSEDEFKTINPGVKEVYRLYDFDTDEMLGDVICRKHEEIDKESYVLVSEQNPFKKVVVDDYRVRKLQVPIFENGTLVYEVPTLDEAKEYCRNEYQSLPDKIKDIYEPDIYNVVLSEEEKLLKEYMLYETIAQSCNTAISNSVYQKVKK